MMVFTEALGVGLLVLHLRFASVSFDFPSCFETVDLKPEITTLNPKS